MFICYNCMSKLAKSSLDLTDSQYRIHGVERKNKIHLDPFNINDGDIIHVKTDFIIDGTFINHYLYNIKNKFILLTGTSDYSLDKNDNFKTILKNKNLIHWFTSNPPSEKFDKISFLPIGFQEYERMGNNLIYLKENLTKKIKWSEKKNKIYIPYHSQTNPIRNQIIESLSENDFIDKESKKLDFIDYFEKIKEYKYVLSLRGNGWDCHRHYEILYSRSIPVIEKSAISYHFDLNKIPSLLIDNIDEKIFDMEFNFNNDILLLDYWKDKILSKNV